MERAKRLILKLSLLYTPTPKIAKRNAYHEGLNQKVSEANKDADRNWASAIKESDCNLPFLENLNDIKLKINGLVC